MKAEERNAVIRVVDLPELVARRDERLESLRALARLAVALPEIPSEPGFYSSRVSICYGGSRDYLRLDEERHWEEIRAHNDSLFWAIAMRRSTVWSFMSAKARAQWNERLQNAKPAEIPEFTPANVIATFEKLYVERSSMAIEGILDVFRALSWDYKTNNPVKLGKRIIMRLSRWSFTSGDRLDDLERYLHLCDGRPEPDHQHSVTSRWREAQNERRQQIYREKGFYPDLARMTFETEYFAIKCFQNGNAHITFRRTDLVEQMNRVIGDAYPNALPPAR